MILAKVLSFSLCIGVVSLAYAADPTPPTPTTPPAATAPTAPANTDAASTAAADKAAADQAKSPAAAAKTSASPEGLTPDQVKTLRSAHYRPEVQKGVTYYCRSEAQLGTRFEKPVCGLPDDILRSIAANQQLVNQMQHSAYTGAGAH
jgi:hypothetical protein